VFVIWITKFLSVKPPLESNKGKGNSKSHQPNTQHHSF
jgi:hypothetical protein